MFFLQDYSKYFFPLSSNQSLMASSKVQRNWKPLSFIFLPQMFVEIWSFFTRAGRWLFFQLLKHFQMLLRDTLNVIFFINFSQCICSHLQSNIRMIAQPQYFFTQIFWRIHVTQKAINFIVNNRWKCVNTSGDNILFCRHILYDGKSETLPTTWQNSYVKNFQI